jgi:glyoxylase-like metal-dependent hydrolase (beta-lactamase superfamily II)
VRATAPTPLPDPAAVAARAAPDAGAATGLAVLQRGWLSANQVVFAACGDVPATVVDTGFCTHAQQTLALVDHALGGERAGRIVNTHLHSDHCGGNRAFQDRGDVETWVPAGGFAAVAAWAEDALSYRSSGQACPRFRADRALQAGAGITLGEAEWTIHAAPGHDMDAVMLFEPQTRTLISGDALWEERLAIIFPELVGQDGFGPTRSTLDLIERLAPREVIPGHGRPFGDVAAALTASRERVAAFERNPERHAQHAARALLMFHLLEIRSAPAQELAEWMLGTPIYRCAAQRAGLDEAAAIRQAADHVRKLVDDGVLLQDGDRVAVRPQAH